MTSYADRPWLARYEAGQPGDITPDYATGLDIFRAAVAARPQMDAIRYFDQSISFAELDAASTSFAAALIEHDLQRGDRVGLYLQNDPAFLIALIGTWKAGCAAVAINPMNKQRELSYLLGDSGAVALVCLDDLYDQVAKEVISAPDSAVRLVVTCSALDHQSRGDERVLGGTVKHTPEGTLDLDTLVAQFADRSVADPGLTPDDLAVLTYTSGTTGQPKGAINTHANLAFNAQTYRDWIHLKAGEPVIAIAPLFHITGLVAGVMTALLLPAPLVLFHRFEPGVALDAIREHQPVFTVAAITAFLALSTAPGATPEDFASLRTLYSGGAPIAPAMADRLEKIFGAYIHNVYGLTETTSPSHAVPLGVRAPVDPVSGALSVGVPVYNTVVRVIDDEGNDVPPGEVGEFATSGPQVVAGYWQKPEATASSLPNGELRTGDVGFMNENGWYFVVDRKKDMINASGYKVWPREVEDVLYTHPAVREAAVVGVPDEYRGETVRAFVSLTDGQTVTPEELVQFAKEQMAAYKYPREVRILEELPKTVTGKILRRELRDTNG